MQEEGAEARCERLVLRDVEALVAEEDHAMAQERFMDRGKHRIRQVLREIDAENFRTQRARDGLDADGGHCRGHFG